MAANLLLDYYAPSTLAAGCCSDEFYCLVFNENSYALKDNGFGVLTLQAFLAANQDACSIDLSEHAQRSRYYSTVLAEGDFALPLTTMGQKYTMEFWRRPGGGTKNRSADTLLETRDFWWSGSRLQQARFDDSQLEGQATYFAHLSASYDSNSQVVEFIAWLERNGELVTAPLACNVLWLDHTGSILANTNPVLFLPGIDGVYAWTQSGLDLPPDESTATLTTITDAAGNPHSTVASIVTWD